MYIYTCCIHAHQIAELKAKLEVKSPTKKPAVDSSESNRYGKISVYMCVWGGDWGDRGGEGTMGP